MEPTAVKSAASNTAWGNPAPLATRSGKLFLPYCSDNKNVLLIESSTFGRSWSVPRNISSQVLDPSWTNSSQGWYGGFRWVATGPPGAIELENGRLLVPADIQTPPTNSCHNPYSQVGRRLGRSSGFRNGFSALRSSDGRACTQALAMFSDDGGTHWQHSRDLIIQGSETQFVQLRNGSVLANTRTHDNPDDSRINYRWMARSDDSGTSWPAHLRWPLLDIRAESDCEASMILMHPGSADPEEELLVLSHTWGSGLSSSLMDRDNLTLHISRDGGRRWEFHEQVYAGPAQYSSLAALNSTHVGLLWFSGDPGCYVTDSLQGQVFTTHRIRLKTDEGAAGYPANSGVAPSEFLCKNASSDWPLPCQRVSASWQLQMFPPLSCCRAQALHA
jgi:hypothetical protein